MKNGDFKGVAPPSQWKVFGGVGTFFQKGSDPPEAAVQEVRT